MYKISSQYVKNKNFHFVGSLGGGGLDCDQNQMSTDLSNGLKNPNMNKFVYILGKNISKSRNNKRKRIKFELYKDVPPGLREVNSFSSSRLAREVIRGGGSRKEGPADPRQLDR